ncbi:hypothetical protein C8Q80DRAFT_1265140 [Daedaleopsis nitida]|nr:hypothetical protein C8Q80DRAFT_1265140 [Daedaleopsis nitida]
MRNHILILPLVASAVAVATSDDAPKFDMPSPSTAVVRAAVATAGAAFGDNQQPAALLRRRTGVVRVYPSRQYPQEDVQRPDDVRSVGREREQVDREREEASRAHQQQEHLADGSDVTPTSSEGKDGGVSVTDPAVGADAGDGGDSESSSNGESASGLGLDGVISQITAFGQTSSYGTYNSPADSAYAVEPAPEAPVATYTVHHPKPRSPRITTYLALRKRDNIGDIGGVDGSEGDNDDNSNQDGGDGQSVRGQEVDGGPNGGLAHAGNPGSSEGGHVYNYPN